MFFAVKSSCERITACSNRLKSGNRHWKKLALILAAVAGMLLSAVYFFNSDQLIVAMTGIASIAMVALFFLKMRG